ncbi:hypothetical protein HBI34_052200 [Parastagonospora nodorum]|nr:hypothetical protein HBH42_195850 [Parastagonospora nodorum]KAH6376544.1 hypothetical protein HBI34_052200 [Parastagonospora nodorum]
MVGASNTWPPTSRDERAAEQVPSRNILSADFNPHPLSLHILSDEELYKPGFLVELDYFLSLAWRRRIRRDHIQKRFRPMRSQNELEAMLVPAIRLSVGAISQSIVPLVRLLIFPSRL